MSNPSKVISFTDIKNVINENDTLTIIDSNNEKIKFLSMVKDLDHWIKYLDDLSFIISEKKKLNRNKKVSEYTADIEESANLLIISITLNSIKSSSDLIYSPKMFI
jgi:hypothetical protein